MPSSAVVGRGNSWQYCSLTSITSNRSTMIMGTKLAMRSSSPLAVASLGCYDQVTLWPAWLGMSSSSCVRSSTENPKQT